MAEMFVGVEEKVQKVKSPETALRIDCRKPASVPGAGLFIFKKARLDCLYFDSLHKFE